ncbi:ATP-binding protein, partial [Parafrankia colletiae]|uniref:ATP-binding protein n=1 Tax=Parafrankia colletiae TaxID=573497 RepID=UPI001F5269E0
MTPSTRDHTTPDDQNRPTVDHVTAPNGQAIGINYGQVLQQRFSGPFQLLRHATIDLDPLPGDLRLSDPADTANPVARFRGRTDLIGKIDTFIGRCVQQRRGGYLLVEAEAGMGKSALAAYLAFTRVWPAHFTRLPDGHTPETARLNLAAQLIARWKLEDAAPGGVLPDRADSTAWLYGRLCDAAKNRDRDRDEPDQPVILLVDGLDEAPPPPAGELPLGLPPALPPGTVIVATTRPKTIALPTGSRVVERIDVESTTNRQDLLDYLSAVTTHDPLITNALGQAGMPADRFCRTLLDRSGGVWIYALTVLDQIRDHNRNPGDIDQLPEGLAGYYADNLHRWHTDLGDHTWQTHGLPVLATVTAIREPQTAGTIATWAGVPEPATRQLLRGAFRPFLAVRQGGDPDLYLPRHQSLRDFTTGTTLADSDHEDLRHLVYTLTAATRAAHQRIADALMPPDPVGQRTWPGSSAYASAHLPEHAALAGLLPDLLYDSEFALYIGIPALLRQRHHLAGHPQALAALGALELATGHGTTHTIRLQWIEISARKTQAHTLADNTARLLPDRPWFPTHAIWNGTSHQTLTGHTDTVFALASFALPDGRTLLASASDDLTVRLWDPGTGQQIGTPLTGHTNWVR